MYFLIGDDGQQYGPVDANTLRQWVAQSRANAETRVRADGSTDWHRLGDVPEFHGAVVLQAQTLEATPQPVFYPTPVTIKTTNGFALWGFVLSLIGLPLCACGLISIVSLVFSVVGMLQISGNPHQRGKGLAVAGIVISFLSLVAFVIFWGLTAMGAQAGWFDTPGE